MYTDYHSPCTIERHVRRSYVMYDNDKISDTSNCAVKILIHLGKNKKVIKLMKQELNREIMKEFVHLNPKMFSYLIHNEYIEKKAESIKKCVIKQEMNNSKFTKST